MRALTLLLWLLPLPLVAGLMADEIIYFLMVDRLADGNPDNNQDVDFDNPLAFHEGLVRFYPVRGANATRYYVKSSAS